MKRILALLLAGALLCTLTGCSTAADGQAKHKSLVVYFSATGNTKAVAQYIADAAKATLFELTPRAALCRGRPGLEQPRQPRIGGACQRRGAKRRRPDQHQRGRLGIL